MPLHLKVVALDQLLRDDVSVTTDGRHEAGESLLLLCDHGCERPDHGG